MRAFEALRNALTPIEGVCRFSASGTDVITVATTITLNIPTTVRVGELLVACLMYRSDLQNPPNGWMLIDNGVDITSSAATLQKIAMYAKIASAADAGSTVTFTQASSARFLGQVLSFNSNINTPEVLLVSRFGQSNGGSPAIDFPVLSVPRKNCMGLALTSHIWGFDFAETQFATNSWTLRSSQSVAGNRMATATKPLTAGQTTQGSTSYAITYTTEQTEGDAINAIVVVLRGGRKRPSYEYWNPADTRSELALSNNNLTLTRGGTVDNWYASRGIMPHNTGLRYFEVDNLTNGVTAGSLVVGILPYSLLLSVYPGYSAGSYGYNANSPQGRIYTNGVSTTTGIVTPEGSYARVAVDFDAGKVWFGNATQWYDEGNPETGERPTYTFTPGSKFYPCASLYSAGQSCRIRSVEADLRGVIPGGFTAWAEDSGALRLRGELGRAGHDTNYAANTALSITGGAAPYSVSVISGNFPPSWTASISANNAYVQIGGPPPEIGEYTFSLALEDATGQRFVKSYTVECVQAWDFVDADTQVDIMLDTLSASTTVSGRVASWSDRRANGVVFSAEGAERPWPATVNGRSVMNFQGAQALRSNAAGLGVYRNKSLAWMFGVYKVNNTSLNQPVIYASTGTSTGGRYVMQASENNTGVMQKSNVYWRRKDADTWTNHVSEDTSYFGQWTMLMSVLDFQTGESYLYINGREPLIKTNLWPNADTTSDSDSMHLCVGSWANGNSRFNGYIANVLMGSQVPPSQEEAEKIFGRAAHLLGLQGALAQAHKYKNSPPVL